jgi:hypothetical protein
MSISVAEQLDLFDLGVKTKQWEPASTTFIDNMKLPVHRWFRYSAGFSAEWVKETIRRYAKDWSMILEPFAGSGTTLVAANEMRFPSIGFEKQYFVNRIATVDYYRHGTTTLFAALDVLSGTVIGACKQKHRASECLEFIQKVDKSYPPERALHIIADKYATHKTRAVREYMEGKAGRFMDKDRRAYF